MFFRIYAQSPPVRLSPAWLLGREVIAVWNDPSSAKPSSLMWLKWGTAGSASSVTTAISVTSSTTRS